MEEALDFTQANSFTVKENTEMHIGLLYIFFNIFVFWGP